jgi:hypothetical protein
MTREREAPDVLYRGFGSLDHARQFVNEGVISLGRLDRYRTLEDARRRDESEGTAALRTPAPNRIDLIPEHWQAMNRVYVLCCSAADPALVATKFGRHLVRINKPRDLVADIRSYVSSHSIVPNPEVYATWVRYDRGDSVPASPDVDEWLRLSCSQKPASFMDEQEYRLAILSLRSYQHPAPDPLWARVSVKLSRALAYCDLLPNHAIQRTAGARML